MTELTIYINPEYEALLPKLPKEEYEALKVSVQTEGLHYPIVVNAKGEILDGHNRFRICQELGLNPKIDERHFEDKLLEKKFVIEVNLRRRHLNTFQQIELAKPLLEIEKNLAQERMVKGDPRQNFAEGKAMDLFASKVGSNPETVRQAFWLMDNAPKETVEDLRKGKIKIYSAFKDLTTAQKIEELKTKISTLQEPSGFYDVIVIDPAWETGEYSQEGFRGGPIYPTLSLEAISKLNLPMTENCVVWLWTVNRHLHDAFHILEAWHLEPKSVLTWVKNNFGVGVWLRGQTEHCILATKGKPTITLTKQSTVLFADKGEHSEKPDEFYQMVDSLCIGKKLDYFARKTREGWDSYGTLESN